MLSCVCSTAVSCCACASSAAFRVNASAYGRCKASQQIIYWRQCVSFCTSKASELSIYCLPRQCAALLLLLPHICGEFENVGLCLVGRLHQLYKLHPRVLQLLVFRLHCQVVRLLLPQYLYFCTRKASKMSSAAFACIARFVGLAAPRLSLLVKQVN